MGKEVKIWILILFDGFLKILASGPLT